MTARAAQRWTKRERLPSGQLVVALVPEVQLASGELAAYVVEQATASGVEDGDPLGADALALCLFDKIAGHSGVVLEASLDLFEVDVAGGAPSRARRPLECPRAASAAVMMSWPLR